MKVETLIKATVVLLAIMESGCGLKMGENVVIGSTGFLQESNRAQMKDWDYYSQNEKVALNKEINK